MPPPSGPRASILGFGSCLPERIVTNQELASRLGVDPAWILEACGIQERRWAGGESVADLAEGAAREALSAAGIEAERLGGIILGSGSPARQFPGLSADLQRRLGCRASPAFDVHLASSGGMIALCLARDLCGTWGPILVVGAEKMSEIVQRDLARETGILFGDGAGAAVVASGEGPLEILDASWASDGAFADELALEFGSGLRMNGRAVVMQAHRKLLGVVQELLKRNGLDTPDLDLCLFHQANLNLLRQVGKSLGLEAEKIPITLDRYGNTSAASVLIAAAEAWRAGRLGAPSLAVMAAFGSGFSWGGMLLRAR